MLTSALAARVRGIHRSRKFGPGHGAPSSDSVSLTDGLRLKTRKNTKFAMGAKNNAASHVGSPASRKRFTVIARPSQIKGSAKNNMTPAKSRFSRLKP